MQVLAAVLAKGHVLLEDYPGLGKTLAARSFAQALGLDFARAQFTPDLLPGRPDRLVRLRPAARRVRVPARPALHRAAAGRRDQPHAAQDPVRAARGDAGAAGHRRGRDVPAARRRSTCSRPPTRSSTKAPTRCPRPSSTGSCCGSASATPPPDEEYDVLARRWSGAGGGRRSTRSPTAPGCWRCRRRSRRCTVDESVGRYCVDLAARHPRPPATCSPAPRRAARSAWCSPPARFALMRRRDYVIPEDVKAVARAVLAAPDHRASPSSG